MILNDRQPSTLWPFKYQASTVQLGSEIWADQKEVSLQMVLVLEWDLKWGSLTISNLDKWLPFCQKTFEIGTKMSKFWMVWLSNGVDHSYSLALLKPNHFKSLGKHWCIRPPLLQRDQREHSKWREAKTGIGASYKGEGACSSGFRILRLVKGKLLRISINGLYRLEQ